VKKRFQKIVPLLILIVLVSLSACFASDDGGEGGSSGKIYNLIMRVVNFAILAGILWYFLADKIKKYFSERRVEIAQMIEEVDVAKSEAQRQFEEFQQKMQNVEKDIKEIKDTLSGEIEIEKARIMEEGKAAAERIVEQAKWSAEQEILKAKRSLRDQVVDMAGEMATEMITKNMTPNDQKVIVEEYLDKVGKEH